MKLNDFSGGLSTRMDPTLIGPNEAVVFTNIDNAKGSLTSIKDYLLQGTAIDRWFYKFKDVWYSSINDREYIEYKNKLYWTEKENKPSKVVNGVIKPLGIVAPTTKLTSVLNGTGNITGDAFVTPPGNANKVASHPSGYHVAVCSDTSPYLRLYKNTAGKLVKLTDPASMPASAVKHVSYCPNGVYLAIVLVSSPFVIIYKRSGDVYTKLTNPVTLPTGSTNGLSWSPDGIYLSVAHSVSPYVTIYKNVSDVFTKLTDPATLPTGTASGCTFSYDSIYLTVCHSSSPYITIYKRAADVFTKLTNPATLPASNAIAATFSLDGAYLSVAVTSSPYIVTYSRSVDVFTKLTDPATLPLGLPTDITYSYNFNYLVISHAVSPYVTIYKRSGDVLTAISGLDTVTPGAANGLAFSADDQYLAVAHNTTPYLTIYRHTADSFTKYNLTSVVQYMYTYYDSSEGVESAPSPVSDELGLPDGNSVDLSGFLPSDNYFVDKFRLYRVGADATDFTLLIEIPASTTTYNDNIKTLDALGDILDAYNNQAPLIGLRYIIEAYGIMFAAIGSTLYYTETGYPDYWATLNTVPISGDITGLVAIPDGIVIFTNSKAYMLLGTDPSTFRIILLNPEHGCIAHNSIKVVKNTLLWASADGVCGLSGNSISVVTKDKLDRVTLNAVSGTVFNEQYMLTLTDGSVFIIDARFNGSIFKTLKYVNADVYNLGVFDNTLYGVVKEELALIEAGRLIDFYYESPMLTEGDASVTKLYNNIYVSSNGRFIFDVYIDEVLVSSDELIGNQVFEIKVPQEKQRGSSIQFKVQGTGVVREIEYKTVGRENGR